jgi:hypothetical protein
MTTTYRWLVWCAATAAVIIFGFQRGWDTFHKFCLGVVLLAGVFQLILPIMQKRMLQKIKNLPLEEREKFLSRFDDRTREKLRKQLGMPDDQKPGTGNPS